MERSETGAEGDDMESLGPGDGGYGVDYEFEQSHKGSLGFVGADKVKELKRDVRKAWEAKGQGHFGLTPTARQTGVLWAYGVRQTGVLWAYGVRSSLGLWCVLGQHAHMDGAFNVESLEVDSLSVPVIVFFCKFMS